VERDFVVVKHRRDAGGASRTAVRVVLPGSIALAGVALVIAGGSLSAIGAALIGAAILVAIANLLIRLATSSTADRDREAAARQRFTRTGRWPREP
jgi:hypothetical protein